MKPNLVPESLERLYLPYPKEAVFPAGTSAKEAGSRLVRVYVPAHEAGQRLPVVYMTDGQNLFDVESSGFGCWYSRETVRRLQAEGFAGVIVVGIHTDGPMRMPELTPGGIGPLAVAEKDWPAPLQGELFDRFVTQTVIPAVEKRFPVLPGRENRAFCGSSAGGMMCFFTTLCHPALYAAAGVLSPAFLLFRPEDLQRWTLARADAAGELPDLYVFAGAADALEQGIAESVKTIWPLLEQLWPAQRRQLVLKPEQRHHETAWEPELAAFLRRFLSAAQTEAG